MTNASRLLVVDDEPSARELFETLLVNEGYEVRVAASGPEALRQAERQRPDVIVLDIMMPELDGYETCRLLRERPALKHVPILMVSALSDDESRERALWAGADEVFAKPINRREMRARLRALARVGRFRRLVELEGLYARFAGLVSDGIFVVDRGGTVVFANDIASRRLGITAAAEVDSIVSGEHRDGFRRLLKETIGGGMDAFADVFLLGADSRRLMARVRATEIEWQGQPAVQFIVREAQGRGRHREAER